MNVGNLIALIVLATVLAGVIGTLGHLALRYRLRWKAELARRAANLPIDLEMATSDQLIKELRGRHLPYLLLRPSNEPEEGSFGLSLEVSGIDPVNAAGILGMAAALSVKELRRQGVEFPSMEGPDAE